MVEKKSKTHKTPDAKKLPPEPKAHAGSPAAEQTADNKTSAHKKGGARNIGIPVKNPPAGTCSDVHCAYHGRLSVRGRIFEGTVISDKMEKGVVVEWNYLQSVPKYKRFMRKKSRVAAHNPPCIHAHKGDAVVIAECRPISKTKSFVVIEVKKA